MPIATPTPAGSTSLYSMLLPSQLATSRRGHVSPSCKGCGSSSGATMPATSSALVASIPTDERYARYFGRRRSVGSARQQVAAAVAVPVSRPPTDRGSPSMVGQLAAWSTMKQTVPPKHSKMVISFIKFAPSAPPTSAARASYVLHSSSLDASELRREHSGGGCSPLSSELGSDLGSSKSQPRLVVDSSCERRSTFTVSKHHTSIRALVAVATADTEMTSRPATEPARASA
mmetsp:Transcript_17620/g.29986  ORF Transcript_17620/g.29986 Transcript_17620/m.29986 type:complete len:231 (-) Transcript_17620:470-1162(-)